MASASEPLRSIRTPDLLHAIVARVCFAYCALAMALASATADAQWVQVNNGLQDLTINALETIDTVVFAGTAKGLYRSTDAGEHWDRVGMDTVAVKRIATDGPVVLVQSDSALLYSSDQGVSWTRLQTTAWWKTSNDISAIAVRGKLVLVGTYGLTNRGMVMIYRSEDLGTSWLAQSVPTWFHDRGGITSICVADSLLYMAMRDEDSVGDIFCSADRGVNWTVLPRFPTVNDRRVGISDLDVAGTTIFATVYYYGGGTSVRRSTDGGATWTNVETYGPFGTFRDLTSNERSILVRTGDIVLRSQDNGTGWKDISGALTGQKVSCLAMSLREAYAGVSGNGVYRLSLTGALGVTIRDDENRGRPGTNARVVLSDTNGAIVGQARTDTNSTVTWNGLPDGAGYRYTVWSDPSNIWGEQFWGERTGLEIVAGAAKADTFVHNTPYIPSVAVYIDSTNELLADGMLKPVAPGTRLRIALQLKNPATTGSSPVPAFGAIRFDRDRVAPFDVTLYADPKVMGTGTTETFVFYCNAPVTSGSYALSAAAFASSDRYPVSLTDASSWHDAVFSVSSTGVVVERSLPTEFSLAQNYPNPFNPSTVIRFAVPAASHVNITMFNALGQRVAALVDQVMDAGYHEILFDAARLPSGVYLYRMRAGDFDATHRLVVVK